MLSTLCLTLYIGLVGLYLISLEGLYAPQNLTDVKTKAKHEADLTKLLGL